MADTGGKQAERPSAPSEPATQTSTTKPVSAADEDSDPDFDDLDDVLDQFSANAPTSTNQPAHSTAQSPPQSVPTVPGAERVATVETTGEDEIKPPLPSGPQPNESEEDFIARLSDEMSAMLGSLAADPSKTTQSPEDLAKMGKELEDFTHKMEQEGIKPEDLLKALLGDEDGSKIADLAHEEREKLDKLHSSQSSSSATSQPQAPASITTTSTPRSPQRPAGGSASTNTNTTPSSPSAKPQAKSFEDTIRSTMSRLGASDKSATTAAQKQSQKSEEDLLADMLRALESSSGDPNSAGDADGLSKMFLDMMQQLTHKDLLYEPMKELSAQYPSWLEQNKTKLKPDEYDRYSRQAEIVSDITKKFEEPGFNDDNPACRDFIWEKMQKMQEEGAPPEELVKNPFPGTDFSGIPGLGGGGAGAGADLPEGLGKELEEGCPTQ